MDDRVVLVVTGDGLKTPGPVEACLEPVGIEADADAGSGAARRAHVTVVVLPGDGIGPEVMREALRALEKVAPDLELEEHAFGAQAIRDTGDSLPEETLAACKASEAVLKGPIGDPEFDAAEVRPEQGMLRLRAELDVYANLRPAEQRTGQTSSSCGSSSAVSTSARAVCARTAPSTTRWSTTRARSSASPAARFELARARQQRVVSVDKANVLDTSRMWRRVVDRGGRRLRRRRARAHARRQRGDATRARAPTGFDVIVTENMFGDILSDLAAVAHRRHRARAVGEPLGQRARALRAGPWLGAGHRGPGNRQSRRDAALYRAHARARARPGRRGASGSARRRKCATRLPDARRAASRHRRVRRRRAQRAVVAKRGGCAAS